MPPLPNRLSPTLAAIHAKRAASAWKSRGNTFIGASEAAQECPRAVWYGFRWVSPPESLHPTKIRLFETGHIEEKRILDDIEAIEGVRLWRVDPETGKQWHEVIDGYVAVRPDAVVLGLPGAEKTPHVVECKTANKDTFVSITKKGLTQAGQSEDALFNTPRKHWIQCQIQMLGLGISRCLYFLINKNNDEEYVERIMPNKAVAKQTVDRLVSIAKLPRPPGRIEDEPLVRLCRFCRHKDVCHDGVFARVNCRTCLSSTPRPGGNWWCERWGKELTPEMQEVGCPSHLFIPDLVAGEQIDASEDSVTYRMPDGREWVDGVWIDGVGKSAGMVQ